MQNRVHRPRAHFVTVARKFLDHLESKHFSFTGMMQDMQSNQSGIKVSIFHVLFYWRRWQDFLKVRGRKGPCWTDCIVLISENNLKQIAGCDTAHTGELLI